MTHIIGIMAMIAGFISMSIQNYIGAFMCFLYAFILWIAVAITDRKRYKEQQTANAETIKKFGERVYKYFSSAYCWRRLELMGHIGRNRSINEFVDDLVKEMTED